MWSEVVVAHGEAYVSDDRGANVFPPDIGPRLDGKPMIFGEIIVAPDEIRERCIEIQTELFDRSKVGLNNTFLLGSCKGVDVMFSSCFVVAFSRKTRPMLMMPSPHFFCHSECALPSSCHVLHRVCLFWAYEMGHSHP